MNHQSIYPTNSQTEFYTPEHCHITEIFNVHQHSEISIAQARVEPGVTTANHLLRDTAEWYYILRGVGEMYLDGMFVGRVGTGDVVYIPANTPQCIRNIGTEDLVFLCVCVPGFGEGVYEDMEPTNL